MMLTSLKKGQETMFLECKALGLAARFEYDENGDIILPQLQKISNKYQFVNQEIIIDLSGNVSDPEI